MNCIIVIHNMFVYILYKESKASVYVPFSLEEVQAIVMSPSNPLSAAFHMKSDKKL